MPQALPAVAAWAAAAWSSAVTATAVGLTKVGVMAAIGEGATIALAGKIVGTAAMIGLSAGAAALMRPNTPSSGTTLDFKPDPKAPVRGAMGYTALGGNKVFQATWGYNRVAMSLGVALSLGPIDQITQFRADDAVVSFNPSDQYEATGFYGDDMWQRTTQGLPSDAALLPPTGLKYGNPGLTGWGSQNAAPGVAFALWTMVLAKNPEDRDIFTNGVPDPRWIGRWMKVWDPRQDSTYPGGSGSQRRDDWRTWGWSENPYVHGLAWARGHYKMNLDGSLDRTKRVAGIGAPDAAIDLPAFVEGMNVADANAWTISGEWSTSDSKFQTLVAMLQAGGGEPISRGAQISVIINAPRVATYTYTRDDLIGAGEVRPLTPRRERKNTITPRYRSEAHGWEYVPAGEVTHQVYRDEDRGEPRSLEIEYVHVRNAKQAGQLAAYDLANLREGLTATLPSKAHLMHVHAGDCITVDVPELALANQKFVVRRVTANYESAAVTLELRSESDGKHAWALGQAANPPPSPGLSAVDPKYVSPPPLIDWVVVPRPPAVDGTSQPVLVVTGVVETSDIASVIIEYSTTEAGPWTVGYSGPPMLGGQYEITGLEPSTEYWVSVRYVAKNGARSDRLVIGPVTTGGFSVEAQPYARDLAKGGFASTSDMPKSTAVTYSTPNGTGQLRVTYPATGTSTYFAWNLGRPGAKACVIRARVRAADDPITAAHWDGRLTYATAALAHSLTAGRMSQLAFPGDITAAKWRVLEWEADNLTDYLTSTIDAVRFYLLKPGAPPIDIDWLEVGYREGATANTGKLADQDEVDFDDDIVGPGKPVSGAGKIYADAVTTNTTPGGYVTLLPTGGVRLEVKDSAALGNTRASGNTVVQTDVPESGWAGAIQVMRTPSAGSFKRSANTATSWRGWTRDYNEEQKPLFGYDLEETPGVLATVAAYKTGVGTSAFVNNQGALATKDAVDFDADVGGANKPLPNAGKVFDNAITTNTTPGAYRTLIGTAGGTRLEVKSAASLGNSRASGNVIVETQTPPGASGVVTGITQVMRTPSEGSFKRSANTATSWRGWTRAYNEEQKPLFGLDLEETAGVLATVANFKTNQGTSAFVNNQGDLTTRDNVYFGSNLVRETNGGAAATLAGFKTNQGTSAFVNGQGKLATQDGVDFESDVTGLKPVAGAGQIFDGTPTVNSPPSYYLGLFPQGGIRAELKMPASLGNSRGGSVASVTTTEARAGSYVGMVQIMRTPTSGVFKRDAASNTAWFGWVKSYDEDVKPRFGSDLLNASGGTATDAAYQTGLGTAKYIENQGGMATRDGVDLAASYVSGKDLANIDPSQNSKINGMEAGANKTETRTAAYINNQGPAATGSDADYKTSLGLAAGMNGESLTGNYGDDPLPSFYRNRGIATYNERKAQSIVGGSGSQYGTLRTEVTDTRTDRPIIQQYIFNSGLTYQRNSNSGDGSWTDWQKFYGQGQKPAFGDGIPRNAASGNGVVLSPNRPLGPVSGYANSRIAVASISAKFGDGTTLSLPSGTITGLSSDTPYSVFRRFSNGSYVVTSSAATAANYKTNDDYLFIGLQVTAATSGGSYSPPPPPPPGGGGGLTPWIYDQV